jgi:glutathione S-transferase
MTVLDERLAMSRYVALERYTMADIGAFVCVDFAAWIKLPVTDRRPNIRRWHERISERPSATA